MAAVSQVFTTLWKHLRKATYRPAASNNISPNDNTRHMEQFIEEDPSCEQVGVALANNMFLKEQPKHKVFGRDIPGTSETQTSGHPGQKLYATDLFSSVLDREPP